MCVVATGLGPLVTRLGRMLKYSRVGQFRRCPFLASVMDARILSRTRRDAHDVSAFVTVNFLDVGVFEALEQ